jgi:hypothetical protein
VRGKSGPFFTVRHGEIVLAIAAGIIVARHLKTPDDLFGGPQDSPRTDKMVVAAIQWAQKIMERVDETQTR